ncbi:MAG: lysine decarboxylase, partial [Paracoccaceae bacterium]|nr:lysine decarboxylase [Paracoccaceae bacterium]
MKDDARTHPFRDSQQDVEAADRTPDTAQTRASAYRLAFADDEFMCRKELRPVRLQLELLKPELVLDERGVISTIVLFGGARIPDPARKETARTPALADLSHYNEESRRIAYAKTERSIESDGR